MKKKVNLVWFKRDLRLNDNHALYEALKQHNNILPVFIFDKQILDKLEKPNDLRVQFIHQEITELKKQLNELGSDFLVEYGDPHTVWEKWTKEFDIENVYCNRDFEPYALKRDNNTKQLLESHNIGFHTFKDQCVFEYDEVLKDDGKPYTVYTPYSKKWKIAFANSPIQNYPSETFQHHFAPLNPSPLIPLESMGFKAQTFHFPTKTSKVTILQNYEKNRDIPSIEGTSKLSLHFRFGTISIREKAYKAKSISEKWLNELIWRDFYMQILAHFPHVEQSSFKKEYNAIEWINNEKDFEAWCQGKTGYPIVDAGMRELNTTGLMHNRVRMIVASFLCKHLLIDWRWGEAYFAKKLLDFELASNNGGWQWAAGSGVDAAPYFRIFNPELQTAKFDPLHLYIKKWVPEFGTNKYPQPIVEHTFARNRCLETYKKTLKPQETIKS